MYWSLALTWDGGVYDPHGTLRRFRMNIRMTHGGPSGKCLVLQDDDFRIAGHMEKTVSVSFRRVDFEE